MNIIKRIIAQFQIPEGPYCYEPLGTFLTEDGKSGIRTKVCPYWKSFGIAGNKIVWCYLLDKEEDPLLDDQCKICGIKENFEK